MSLRIRAARAGDRAFVLEVAPRLAGFGPPPWRTPAEVVGGEVRTLEAFFRQPPDTSALLICETGAGDPLGFVYLEEVGDYFTLERHGHVGIIAVAAAAEGRGAGAMMLSASEDWARARGYRKLTLSVFEDNTRARRVYERAGFAPDTIKYLKVI